MYSGGLYSFTEHGLRFPCYKSPKDWQNNMCYFPRLLPGKYLELYWISQILIRVIKSVKRKQTCTSLGV